jgi:hypothetical protein
MIMLWRGMGAHTGNDNPSNSHRGDNKDEQSSNVLHHIRPWQLDPNSEQTNDEHHSHDLECDCLSLSCPTTRVEYVRAIGSHDHSKNSSDDDFADVQLVANKQRKHSELSV